MTAEEAIRGLRFLLSYEEMPKHPREVFETAIEALETIAELEKRGITIDAINEYKIFEDECASKGFTFKSLLEARERMTPKKPVRIQDAHGYKYYCPNCKDCVGAENKRTRLFVFKRSICDYCGQDIDWGEE